MGLLFQDVPRRDLISHTQGQAWLGGSESINGLDLLETMTLAFTYSCLRRVNTGIIFGPYRGIYEDSIAIITGIHSPTKHR